MRERKGGCRNAWTYVLTCFKCLHSRMRQPASRSVRLCGGRGRRDGYAQVPQIHHRSRLDHRLRLLRQPRAVWVAHQVLKTTHTHTHKCANHACFMGSCYSLISSLVSGILHSIICLCRLTLAPPTRLFCCWQPITTTAWCLSTPWSTVRCCSTV